MNALRSEWLKLITVRTTWFLLGGMMLVEGSWAVALSTVRSPSYLRHHDVSALFTGTGLMTVFVFTLGALLATNEFRHGTANSTFVITPQRERVVAAKLAIGLLAGVVAALEYIAVNAGLGLSILSNRHVPVDAHHAVNVYAGLGIGMVLSCLFGVALGMVIRNQVVTVVVGMAIFFVLRGFPLLLGKPAKYFPDASLAALQGVGKDFLLTQVQGGLVFSGYVIALGIAGAVLIRKREINH